MKGRYRLPSVLLYHNSKKCCCLTNDNNGFGQRVVTSNQKLNTVVVTYHRFMKIILYFEENLLGCRLEWGKSIVHEVR